MLEALLALGVIVWVFIGGYIALPALFDLEKNRDSFISAFRAYKDVLVRFFFKDRNIFGVILGVFLSLITSSGILILLVCKIFHWFCVGGKFIYKLGEKKRR